MEILEKFDTMRKYEKESMKSIFELKHVTQDVQHI